MRQELLITRVDEAQAIDQLSELFKKKYPDVNASNALVVMVSPDYSASAAMHLAHELSHEEEMCDLLCIDVPYPDQDREPFIQKATDDIYRHNAFTGKQYKYIILVEAGVIRGSNYRWLTLLFKMICSSSCNLITTALYENTHSAFKSDVVVHYYNNEKQDLTFYFEKPNKHWS
jgi:hypothetical protein